MPHIAILRGFWAWGVRVSWLTILSCGLTSIVVAQNPPQNPINRLFKNLDNQIRGVDEDEVADETGRMGRDAFDVRTPQNPDNTRRLGQAERFIRDARWPDAVEVLQFLLDQPQDSFRLVGRTWTSLRTDAEALLHSLPEAGQRSYESQYGVLAVSLYQEAIDSGDESQLTEVARRFRHLPAGMQARQALITLWYGRGDTTSARRLAEQLHADHPTFTTAAVQAASCLEQQGQRSQAAEKLGRTLGWQTVAGVPPATSPLAWLETLHRDPPAARPEAPPSDPLLLPVWVERRIASYNIEEQVSLLLRDLNDNHRGIRPVSWPVFTRDLLIYHDLGGLKARRLSTGELVWQDLSRSSVESRLISSGSVLEEEVSDESLFIEHYDLSQLDQHPLGTVLFRDGVSSALMAREGRLYSIERQDPLAALAYSYYWQAESGGSKQPGWSVNELVCRDAASGRRLWTLGGPQIEPAFSRPLADAYFFGPPVLFEDQLLVIAELNAEMMLFGLAPRTGEVLWSQAIASSGRPLKEDPVRRMWSCQPTVADGQIICPTSSGWLISLDAHTRQLNWGYRFPPRDETGRPGFRRGYNMNSVQPLNQRWGPSQPLVDGDRILVTPPELPDDFNSLQPMLVCLDLQGELVWQQAKQEALIVAGIHDHRVILVGKTQIKAIDLSDGAPVWETRFPEELGQPCGTGLIQGDVYLQPMGEHHLLQLNLKSGEMLQTLALADRNAATLGNLAVHRGLLVSLSPRHLCAFSSVDAEQRVWRQLGELSPERILRESQMFLSKQSFPEALATLDRVPVDARGEWKPELRDQARHLEWQLLVRILAEAPAGDFSALSRLAALAESPAERTLVSRHRAAQMISQNDPVAGARILLDLVQQSPAPLIQNGNRNVRLDADCGGQLAALYSQLPADQQHALDELFAAVATEFAASDVDGRDRVANALAFHPVGNEVQLSLARQAAADLELTRAAIRYRRVARTGTVDQQLTALHELADMYSHQHLTREAISVWKELTARPQLPAQFDDGTIVSEVAAMTLAELQSRLPPAARDWEAIWRTQPVKVSLAAGERSQGPYQVMHSGQFQTGTPRQRFLYHTEQERLNIEDTGSGELIWSLPLRSLEDDGNASNVGVTGEGVASIVLHRGVIHALGLNDRDVLWNFVPDMREEGPQRLRTAMRSRNINMKSAASLQATYGARASGQNGFVLGANDWAVVLQLRQLVVLDALTGDILWTEQSSQSSTQVILRDDVLVQVDEQGREHLRRVRDGSVVPDSDSEVALLRAFQIRRTHIIRLDPDLESAVPSYVFRSSPIEGGADLWAHQFPKSASYSLIDPDHVAILTAEGTLSLLSLTDGTLLEIGVIPESLLSQKRRVTILGDAQRLYAVVEYGRAIQMYAQMTSLPMNGALFAFSRSGGLLWQRESRELPTAQLEGEETTPMGENSLSQPFVLALTDFETVPTLVLLSEFNVPGNNGLTNRRIQVICLDKQTGNVLLNWHRPSNEAGFARMRFDQRRGWLELDSSNYRLRVRAE